MKLTETPVAANGRNVVGENPKALGEIEDLIGLLDGAATSLVVGIGDLGEAISPALRQEPSTHSDAAMRITNTDLGGRLATILHTLTVAREVIRDYRDRVEL